MKGKRKNNEISTGKETTKKTIEKSDEELKLEELLFGKDILDSGKLSEDIAEAVDFTIDTNPNQEIQTTNESVWHDEDDDEIEVDLNKASRLKKLKLSKNHSGNDTVSGREFQQLLQERIQQTQTTKSPWAKTLDITNKQSDNDIDEVLNEEDYQLLNEAGSMLAGKSRNSKWTPLRDGKIYIKRVNDINTFEPSNSSVTTTDFHSNSELFLIGSEDKQLKLFQLKGEEDNYKHEKKVGIKFPELIPRKAQFLGTSNEIIISGRKPQYYSYDIGSGHLSTIPALMNKGIHLKTLENMTISPLGSKIAFVGSQGHVYLVNGKSKQLIGDLKMNSTARAITFLDEMTCITSGYDSDVYLWDLRYTNGRCVSRFSHEDGTATTCLSAYVPPPASPSSSSSSKQTNFYSLNNVFLSIGTMSGVASIYEGGFDPGMDQFSFQSTSSKASNNPSPMKNIMNLTTPITSSVFHPSGQILAIASKEKKDSLKLVHLPTGNVFNNWPVETIPLNVINTLNFSPNGKYMTVGNARGKVLLFKLNHFAY